MLLIPIDNNSYRYIQSNKYLDEKLNLCSQLEAKVKTVREKMAYTPKEIQEINNAAKQYKIKSAISPAAAHFLKIYTPAKYDDFMLRNQFALDRIKFINKLADLQSSKINVSDEVGKPQSQTVENDLLALLIDEHLYERMKKFGHHFEPGKEPRFRMKRVDNFQDLCKQFPNLADKKIQFFEDQKGDGLEIRIRGHFEDGRYKNISLDSLSKEQLQEILSKNEAGNIDLVHPTKLMNIDELLKEGIFKRDDKTNALYITEGYQYLANGFEFRHHSAWTNLEPIGCLKQPPKEFRMDVLIHKPKNGGLGAQGHASLRISTPSGEIYSVGFLPQGKPGSSDDDEDSKTIFGKFGVITQGAIQSPDHFIFLPKSAYDTETIAFDLKGSDNFHKVIEYIKNLKGNPLDEEGYITASELLFQGTHHNCAVFAKEIADFATKNGASRLSEKPVKFTAQGAKVGLTSFALNAVSKIPKIANQFKASTDLKGTPFENLKVADLYGTPLMPSELPYALS